MPKPCSKPLAQNPYESYRDPITGQWKIKYPVQTCPATQPPRISEMISTVEDPPKRKSKRRQWKKSSQTKVA